MENFNYARFSSYWLSGKKPFSQSENSLLILSFTNAYLAIVFPLSNFNLLGMLHFVQRSAELVEHNMKIKI